jgi:hypothetical protein
MQPGCLGLREVYVLGAPPVMRLIGKIPGPENLAIHDQIDAKGLFRCSHGESNDVVTPLAGARLDLSESPAVLLAYQVKRQIDRNDLAIGSDSAEAQPVLREFSQFREMKRRPVTVTNAVTQLKSKSKVCHSQDSQAITLEQWIILWHSRLGELCSPTTMSDRAQP